MKLQNTPNKKFKSATGKYKFVSLHVANANVPNKHGIVEPLTPTMITGAYVLPMLITGNVPKQSTDAKDTPNPSKPCIQKGSETAKDPSEPGFETTRRDMLRHKNNFLLFPLLF